MTKTKTVKLRAFKILNDDINQSYSDAHKKLVDKLKNTVIKDRGMLLNKGDAMEETDYIAYYDERSTTVLVGAIVRTTKAEETPNMTEDMLNQGSIVISELNKINGKMNIVKYLYYFAISKDYLVTNLRKNQKIISFQSYLNWLLKKERDGSLYEIEPVIRKQVIKNLKNIKGLTFETPKGYQKKERTSPEDRGYIQKLTNIKKEILGYVLPKDTKNLQEILDDDSITVDILLKFATRTRDEESIERRIGTIINNITDTDAVSITTKNEKVKLGDVELVRNIEIDTTETGLLEEEQLYVQMEKFLKELNNEK